jgi:hypothetical protein
MAEFNAAESASIAQRYAEPRPDSQRLPGPGKETWSSGKVSMPAAIRLRPLRLDCAAGCLYLVPPPHHVKQQFMFERHSPIPARALGAGEHRASRPFVHHCNAPGFVGLH